MFQRNDGLWGDMARVPGQKKYKYFYGKSPAEVKKKMAAWCAEQEKGITICTALERWIEAKEKEVSYKTLEGYKAPIQRINATFGDTPLAELTPAQIQAFINGIAAKGYKRTTVQRPLDVLRMMYDYFITAPGSNIKHNPCHSVRIPSGLVQQHRELISDSDREIVKNSVDIDFGLFAYFIMFSGLRDGEVLAIQNTDIVGDEIIVTKSISWQPNKPVIKSPKTASGIRKVPLLSPLRNALPQKWNGYLFSADGGKTPLTQIAFRHRWDNYCRAAGLADCSIEIHRTVGANGERFYKRKIWKNRIVPYQLRHEFATICFDAGIDPKDVAEWMGHSTEEMARRTYTHIKDSRRVKTASKLEEFVKNL